MILHTCELERSFGGLPGPIAHPCGRAALVLDDGDVISGSGRIADWAREQG